jgi:hypothetical protein
VTAEEMLNWLERHAVSATIEISSNGPRAYTIVKHVGSHTEWLVIGAKSLRDAIVEAKRATS